ncbi:Linear gramicidin dehydrogenase LgrE [compost metagenome]
MADDEVSVESLAAWKELTRNESELLMLEGDHFFLHEEQERIAEKVNGSLSKTPVIHHAY